MWNGLIIDSGGAAAGAAAVWGAAVLGAGPGEPGDPVAETVATAADSASSANRVGLGRSEFEGFYERTARRLWAYLSRASGDPSLADDLTQEAFLRFLRSGFVGDDEDHRRGYLFRIGTNLLRDRRRRAWRELPADAAASEPAAAASSAVVGNGSATLAPGAEQRSLRRDLTRVLARLDVRQRQLVWLAHVEGASHREIADILGVREASVRPMLFRARRKMAELLRAEGMAPAPRAAEGGGS